MLGIEDSSQVVIGTVPEPDMAAIEAVDYESDKIRPWEMTRMCRMAATPQPAVPLKSISDSGWWMRRRDKGGSVLASYQNLQASKTAYEAALTAFRAPG